MGLQANGKMRIGGKECDGQLYLESAQILFRGEGERVVIDIKNIVRAVAEDGTLKIAVGDVEYRFEIGRSAQRWADTISNPRTLIQKLGVKPDSKVAYIGKRDHDLLAELEGAVSNVRKTANGHNYDFIFVGLEGAYDLRLLEDLNTLIKSRGAIWVIFPKRTPELKAEIVIRQGKSQGLVDNKIARISDRLTGMKFVIPVDLRK